jgi:hypothetical protein
VKISGFRTFRRFKRLFFLNFSSIKGVLGSKIHESPAVIPPVIEPGFAIFRPSLQEEPGLPIFRPSLQEEPGLPKPDLFDSLSLV